MDDEIIFGDVRSREPERRRRPDRDRRWACVAYETPRAADLLVFIDHQTADAIERHALRDTTVELGGVLLGKECIDDETGQPFVIVARSLEAKHYENTQASFTYTHDSWEEITRERERSHPDLDIVGWYHTHPDFGIFLSSHDLFIHRHFFAEPLQVAYVVDPVRQTRGFFQWRHGATEQVGGFYIFANRAERVALARLVNDLENVSITEPGSGVLSPRLEAELIAMLTRPAATPMSATDRLQAAVVFGLFGGLAGMLLLAAVFFLSRMSDQFSTQTARLEQLEKSTDRFAARQSAAIDALLEGRNGVTAETFTALYDRAIHERDEARRELSDRATINNTLALRVRELEAAQLEYGKEREALTREVERFRQARKEFPTIEERVRSLEQDLSARTDESKRLQSLLDTVEGHHVQALDQKYQLAWYLAIAGWVFALVAAAGTAVALSLFKTPATVDGGGESAPHRVA